ncbi:major capsid protein [Agrobacterium vitis]|uniref:major capsid protein n=1 Tax=Agrobacterium vitis TaxID=373 RepID=UPI001F394AA8|nr:major capsid protein [Agrobacterium vitis]
MSSDSSKPPAAPGLYVVTNNPQQAAIDLFHCDLELVPAWARIVSDVSGNYRGTDDNSTVAIPTDEASIFPVGASNVFKKFVSPADEFMPFVNTKGQDVYAMNIVDKDRESWAKGELYSYPLYMCVQPQVLRRATL